MEKRLRLDSNGFLGSIKETFDVQGQDLRMYSPLALAYIGDAVYDLLIRTVVVERANQSAANLHKAAVRFVKAQTQATMMDALMGELSQEETDVFKRGRNANSHTVAKNASRTDYRKATGFEALIGYLYLAGKMERALELVKKGVALTEMEL